MAFQLHVMEYLESLFLNAKVYVQQFCNSFTDYSDFPVSTVNSRYRYILYILYLFDKKKCCGSYFIMSIKLCLHAVRIYQYYNCITCIYNVKLEIHSTNCNIVA